MRASSQIEVVYLPQLGGLVRYYIDWQPGMTIKDAIQESGIQEVYPELKAYPCGLFSKIQEREALVQPGDRIEFYRPLTIDPKQKRRIRAKS